MGKAEEPVGLKDHNPLPQDRVLKNQSLKEFIEEEGATYLDFN